MLDLSNRFICAYVLSVCFLASAQLTDQFSSSNHEEVFVLANLGENLTLTCFDKKNFTKIFWYKQNPGQKPQLVSTDKIATVQTEENNQSFTLDSEPGRNDLTITNLSASDSAFYFCIAPTPENAEPDSIVYVSVKDSGLTAVAACGHVLFGIGNKLDFQCKQAIFFHIFFICFVQEQNGKCYFSFDRVNL